MESFNTIPQEVKSSKVLSSTCKLVYAEIYSYHISGKVCSLTNNDFSNLLNKSARTIQRSLRILENYNFISVSIKNMCYRELYLRDKIDENLTENLTQNIGRGYDISVTHDANFNDTYYINNNINNKCNSLSELPIDSTYNFYMNEVLNKNDGSTIFEEYQNIVMDFFCNDNFKQKFTQFMVPLSFREYFELRKDKTFKRIRNIINSIANYRKQNYYRRLSTLITRLYTDFDYSNELAVRSKLKAI